ncbi:hypothetical protein KJ830_06705 [bacterium]|nr:hypothetical protein [bacterium]MBU4510721.1 hypothetical protein [bacterium]
MYLIKSTAIFINAFRGGVINEKVLIAALRDGKIVGAGFDVFKIESTDLANPLFKLENTVGTPTSK